jgi:two-component system C4-dicarboxylate transport sensor histidine kinase DctB
VWLYLRKRGELQEKLANINIELEGRVEVLTSGLKTSNVELKSLVSHYQSTQEKLEQTQYELLQSARLVALGELSATLNHELSQPALALRAYTENSIKLLDRGQYETVQQNFIEMHSICESMANIVSTIKNFARQSSDKMRSATIGDIIKQSTPIVKHLIEKSGATIEYPQNGLELKIRCIPEQIEQVIVNLISNACDAVNKKVNGKIWLNITSTQTTVKISVRNNHPEVGSKELSKLFKPYYTTKKDGLGLGLVLCKRIIEAQDGRIKARICKDGDIEFIITLKKQQQ